MKSKETTEKLKNIASIDVGCPLRKGRTSHEENGCTYTLYPSAANETFCCDAPIPDVYLTRENDLILSVARLNDIALVEKDQTGMLVSDRYLIIRCTESKALPAYILMEMLSDDGSAKRRRLCRDAVLPNQKAKRYEELEFKLPTLEEQEIQYKLQKRLNEIVQNATDELFHKRDNPEEEIMRLAVQYMRRHRMSDAAVSDADGISDMDENDE